MRGDIDVRPCTVTEIPLPPDVPMTALAELRTRPWTAPPDSRRLPMRGAGDDSGPTPRVARQGILSPPTSWVRPVESGSAGGDLRPVNTGGPAAVALRGAPCCPCGAQADEEYGVRAGQPNLRGQEALVGVGQRRTVR